jgi:hypothetical protein
VNQISKNYFLYHSPGRPSLDVHPLPSGDGFILVFLLLLVISAPLSAHHSFPAEYDVKKPLFMDGKVTRVEWQNPHVDMFINVTDRQGKTVNWDIELTPATYLIRDGWKKDTFKPGMDVCVEGFPEKNGKFIFGSTAVLLKATGQIVKTPPGPWAPPEVHYTGKTSCSNRG